jgi:CheY-like chemotaxis protein
MKKILIIEDEVAYIKLLHDEFATNGYKVLEAKNGKTGLTLAKSEHPDIIILDISMPEMDGMTMLEELRKDPYGSSVDVIILTNVEPDNNILQTVLENKPTYYLIKSNTQLADLTKKITELLANK